MAVLTGATETFDLSNIAEDVEDTIRNISPMETFAFTNFPRGKATSTKHEWLTDSLAAATTNSQIEGDEVSSFSTAATVVRLSNQTNISRKTVAVTGTSDAVRQYGYAELLAYQIAKRGRELKRDIESMILGNTASTAGATDSARVAAGLESMISGNRYVMTGNTTGTTPGYATGQWAAPTDGTATATVTEAAWKAARQLAWTDGGNADTVLVGAFQKSVIASFSGANKYAGFYNPQAKAAQGAIVAGVDLVVDDFGEARLVLSRYVRGRTILGLDMEHVKLVWLRPIKFQELAKTGDSSKGMLICEWTVSATPDAHFKIQDLPTS